MSVRARRRVAGELLTGGVAVGDGGGASSLSGAVSLAREMAAWVVAFGGEAGVLLTSGATGLLRPCADLSTGHRGKEGEVASAAAIAGRRGRRRRAGSGRGADLRVCFLFSSQERESGGVLEGGLHRMRQDEKR